MPFIKRQAWRLKRTPLELNVYKNYPGRITRQPAVKPFASNIVRTHATRKKESTIILDI